MEKTGIDLIISANVKGSIYYPDRAESPVIIYLDMTAKELAETYPIDNINEYEMTDGLACQIFLDGSINLIVLNNECSCINLTPEMTSAVKDKAVSSIKEEIKEAKQMGYTDELISMMENCADTIEKMPIKELDETEQDLSER